MNDVAKMKIDRFLKDEAMSNAVYEVIRDSFLKKKDKRDIYILAAERIAVDLLEDSWKELKKYGTEEEKEPQITKQIGL
mgnify:FL=1